MKEKKSYELLVLAENNSGYVSLMEAKAMGIAPVYLSEGVQEGRFQKVARGLYLRKGYSNDPYFVIQFTYRKAVFSGASALYLHGLIDEEPKVMEVTLPQNYMTKGIKGLRCSHANAERYLLGLGIAATKEGHLVSCYDKERAFLEAIRSPGSLDVLAIAGRFFYEDHSKESLLGYAEALGLSDRLAFLETLLNNREILS